MLQSDKHGNYISPDKKKFILAEIKKIKEETAPGLAKRIDEARQMGDLSENAEYHAAREDMAWVQSRLLELQHILDTSEVVEEGEGQTGIVNIGSKILVEGEKGKKEYTIVGAQEAAPTEGKISNVSPLGNAFMGKKTGESVIVELPVGQQKFKILRVS